MLLQKTGYLSTKEAFSLLKALNSAKTFPSIIYWDEKNASNDFEKVKLIKQLIRPIFFLKILTLTLRS